MSRLSTSHRLALRLAGKPSADPRDIHRRLRKALAEVRERVAAAGEQAESVQLFAEALASWQYEEWRSRRARKGRSAPELTSPNHYALVLHALPPPHLERFLRRGVYSEVLGPPSVGMFEPDVAYEDALAGTVAAWLERQQPSYAVAPPVLRSYGDLAELEHGSKQIREQRAHARRELPVLDLGLRWFLPPAQSPD